MRKKFLKNSFIEKASKAKSVGSVSSQGTTFARIFADKVHFLLCKHISLSKTSSFFPG